jgi:hypothetical protein
MSEVSKPKAKALPASVSSPAKLETGNVVEVILPLKQLILDVGGKEELKRLIDAL